VPASATTLVTDFAVVLSSATFSAAAAALAFLIFVQMGVALRPAVWATMVLALATPLAPYSSWYFSEPLAVALFLGAALLMFARPEDEPLTDTACLAAGALLGATLWVRPAHALLVGVFLLALALSGRKKSWPALAYVGVVVVVFGLAYLLRNAFLYDNFFEFGYPDAAEGGKRLNSFETPLGTGLAAFLISPGKSIFLFAPPLIVALAALPQLWRRRRGLALVSAMSLPALLLLYATYTQFEGGYCFGPRYLVPGMVLACLPLGVVAAEGSAVRRKLLAGLFVAGLAVNLVGMATSPLEDQATGKYYDANFNYRLDYNPLAGQGALLVKYLTDGEPAPIGRGFDFWFVYLHKAGVAAATLWLLAALAVACAALSAWQLRRNSANQE